MAVLEYKSFEPQPMWDGTQVKLNFGEYELSIISHSGSYGGKQGLYEIAPFKHGDFVEMPGITDEDDTVKGYLTEAQVSSIIKKMYFLTGKKPVQI